MNFSDGEKLKELERELAVRQLVYPKLLAKGRLTQLKADRQIALLEAVIADYRCKVPNEGPRRRARGLLPERFHNARGRR